MHFLTLFLFYFLVHLTSNNFSDHQFYWTDMFNPSFPENGNHFCSLYLLLLVLPSLTIYPRKAHYLFPILFCFLFWLSQCFCCIFWITIFPFVLCCRMDYFLNDIWILYRFHHINLCWFLLLFVLHCLFVLSREPLLLYRFCCALWISSSGTLTFSDFLSAGKWVLAIFLPPLLSCFYVCVGSVGVMYE